MRAKLLVLVVLAAVVVLAASAVSAAVTFDAETGTGFVGKGDVQLVFGWNNKQLQDNAELLQFRANSEVVTEVSWVCTNSNNQNTQERERTTTISIQGVVSAVARERNQVTGFILEGYDGDPTTSSTTEGNPLNSCPSGPWSLTTPAGDPVVVSTSEGGLQVSIDGEAWIELE
jgi:uncharacterized protein YfaS (alpha-2-macroglobulin family)